MRRGTLAILLLVNACSGPAFSARSLMIDGGSDAWADAGASGDAVSLGGSAGLGVAGAAGVSSADAGAAGAPDAGPDAPVPDASDGAADAAPDTAGDAGADAVEEPAVCPVACVTLILVSASAVSGDAVAACPPGGTRAATGMQCSSGCYGGSSSDATSWTCVGKPGEKCTAFIRCDVPPWCPDWDSPC